MKIEKLKIIRKLSQAFFLFLFVYILWSTTYPLKGLLPAGTFFRTNPNLMFFTAISERVILPGIARAFVVVVFTLLLGRFFCGWVCPLGAMIDFTGNRKKRKHLSEQSSASKRKIKFIILGAIFLASILGVQIAWIFDPIVISARFVSLNLIPTVTLVVDKAFVTLIRNFELYGPVYEIYQSLRMSFLGVSVHYFNNSGLIFLFFLAACLSALVFPRLWCRTMCPLGAIYSLLGRLSLLRRVVDKCTLCNKCINNCPMGAIKDDVSYVKGECILCMDCVYDCPGNWTRFTMLPQKNTPSESKQENSPKLSRKDFIFLIISSIFALGFKGKGKRAQSVIRPPGALKEKEFINRCVRCGNCMKVCPTNGLQPALLQSGGEGIWTPHLVPEIGYCEYNCILCGKVCPTGAIPRLPLPKKQKAKMGIAKIDRNSCIPWAKNSECIVCEEHCPIPSKAIKITEVEIGSKVLGRPEVDTGLCIGCGICQTKCPVRPERAIKVSPTQER